MHIFLPIKNGPYLGVVLYRPWDERMSKMKTAADAKKFFDDVLPMFSEVVREEDGGEEQAWKRE